MSLGITICHHSTSLVMPNGNPPDRFFYPPLTLMIDSYILSIADACQVMTNDDHEGQIFLS